MALKWVAVIGEFEQEGSKLVYVGRLIEYPLRDFLEESGATKPGPQKFPAVGNALVNEWFSGGNISADVQFSAIDEHTGCELILYYDPSTQFMVTAGIGGSSVAMFTIRHYDGKKWTYHKLAGDRANLRPNRKYHIQADVVGSRVGLAVDGVNVLAADLPFALPASQVGVWCLSHDTITISNFQIDSQKPTAFVVMQFTTPYNELYAEVIKPICQEFGLEPIRADEEFGPGIIIADITRRIVEATVVIADITPANPNVYYEVGFAHAVNKPTILIAERPASLPFDVSQFRTLFYENSIHGKSRVEDGLRSHLKAILRM